ncbi:MAG: glycine--tRNA ligase subunit beta [Cyanobium sp.]
MAFFLLEIGTEELPADFARLALPQLEEQLGNDLHGARLPFDALHVMGTPRRLAVLVEGLPLRPADADEEPQGPPAQQAFRDGVPTPAAEGFAKRCGLPVEQLELRDTPKGPFVFASTRQPGRPVAEVLAELIPSWIWGLQGRRFMRWGEGDSRFSRPVRWLVALLDSDVIPVGLSECDPPIQSGRQSRGHRLNPEPVAIPSAQAYESTLAGAGVLVNRTTRAHAIHAQLEEAAEQANGRLDLPESLFEELVDLVEDPRVIEGEVEPSFLSLPPEVLSTVMRAHQRYVPLLRRDAPSDALCLSGEKVLLPSFLLVSNGRPEAKATVKRGNGRVLRARLADAAFFLQADHAVASIDRREALARVTFADGLGSLRDRSERLEWITDVLLAALKASDGVAHASRRAAHLCKHDLVSQMVGEFPELQGVIGAKYLLAEGESREVALAVLEHYRPRGAGDELPESAAGAVLALAERIELLLSIFSRGERPTGSSDPYGLRRAGNGIFQILWHQQWELDLPSLFARGTKEWEDLFSEAKIKAGVLSQELCDFLRQRLTSLLEEEGFDQDIVQAITGGQGDSCTRVLLNSCDARKRVELMQHLRLNGKLLPIQAVVQRASKLAEKGSLAKEILRAEHVVNSELFEKKSETNLLEAVQQLTPLAESGNCYSELAEGLAQTAGVLAAFFDGPESVMVMCPDQERQINRLNLLGIVRNQAAILGDFSRLEGG